jgi:hypothetical protein
MKIGFTLLFFTLFTICQGQNYESNKQSYLKGSETKFTPVTGRKLVTVDNNKLFAELPTGGTFNGTLKLSGDQVYHGKTGKKYELGDNDLMVVYDDEIFLNLMRHKGIAITYYLTNYIEPNSEQQKLNDKEAEEVGYKMDLELYGKFTADCIREKRVKVGMDLIGIEPILGEPIRINVTETTNSFSQQYVYPNMYIYTEMDKVTAIQQTFDNK